MRYFVALCMLMVALCAGSTVAQVGQDEPQEHASPLSGVWQGTVGKQEVRVLLGICGSSYYYLRHLSEIDLVDQGGGLHLSEQVATQPTGYWSLRLNSSNEARINGVRLD